MAVVQAKCNAAGGVADVGIIMGTLPVVGNLLIAWVTCFNGFNAVKAGWTDSGITVTDANAGVCRILYRYVQLGDTATLAPAKSNSSFWNVSVVEVDSISGVWATDLEASQTGASTLTTFDTTSFNSVSAGSLALMGLQCAQASTIAGVMDVAWTQNATASSGGYTSCVGSKAIVHAGDPITCHVIWAHGFTATYIGLQLKQASPPSPPPPAPARVSQVPRLLLAEMNAKSRVSQVSRLAIAKMISHTRVSQVARLTLAAYAPCATRRCQLWKIERKDGVIFRFTSHDQPVDYGTGETYSPCNSLNSSASADGADLEGIANLQLTGIISDDAISAGDIQAGLFDDAYVQVFLVSWEDAGDGVISVDSAYRLIGGWMGTLSQGDQGFKGEVLGPGQRLAQRALTSTYTPNCRWVFGDSRCQIDREAMAVAGVVASVVDNGEFVGSGSPATADAQWDQGSVRWLTGVNAGQECEIKTCVFETAGNTIILWQTANFAPSPGDTYLLLPGCDRTDAACKIYDNYINFGGFKDVPGNDSITRSPDIKYD